MKFIIDAQLPRRLVIMLRELGYEAQHTWGLEQGNRTPDDDISLLADRQDAIVVTKDADFVDTHILKRTPGKLLIITTGNISNRRLLQLFRDHMQAIASALEHSSLVELNQSGLMIH